jgi:hypothetical protein
VSTTAEEVDGAQQRLAKRRRYASTSAAVSLTCPVLLLPCYRSSQFVLKPAIYDPDTRKRKRRKQRVTRAGVAHGGPGISATATATDDGNASESEVSGLEAARDFDESRHVSVRISYASMSLAGKLSLKKRSHVRSHFLCIAPGTDTNHRCQWCSNRWMVNVKHSQSRAILKKRLDAARNRHKGNCNRAGLWCTTCKVKLCKYCWADFHAAKVGPRS